MGENKNSTPLLWDSLHFLITSGNYFSLFLTHRCRNCTISSSASLCLIIFILLSQKLLTTCWQWGINNTAHRHSGGAYMKTHFPRHSLWIYSPRYREQTAICRSTSETSRSILERNVLKAVNFCNFRFCFKQANDENKLAIAVQRQKESAKLEKASGGKVGSLVHSQGWRGRQEVLCRFVGGFI